jgi:CubicO group peptidase (beta-lactamase class C family)
MRRVLTFLTAAVLSLVSLGIGVFTADLPFWRRALQLPLAADRIYLPVAIIGGAPLALATSPPPTLPMGSAIEAAVQRARGAGSRALLVMHDGRLQLELYFAADNADTLLPAGLMARPLAAMAAGVALGDGSISSLDVPVARYLPEWDDEARGRITLRQLLEETSGLETGGDMQLLLRRSPWEDLARLPRFATSKGVRMLLGNDFRSTALRFQLEHEPGGFFNISPANAQLAAVIVERATGTAYEKFIDERLWRAVGAGPAELPLDRRVGMPVAHCCWRAAARDMLRIANLLASDGIAGERRVLPAGWVGEMARASRVNADSGLQVTRIRIDNADGLSASDDDGSAFWVIPNRQLTILNIANPGGTSVPELPGMLLRALVP